MIAPPVQKTPRWAPVVDGRPTLDLGVFRTHAEALATSRWNLGNARAGEAAAVRVWVAIEVVQ
jgi:hypothetical protein